MYYDSKCYEGHVYHYINSYDIYAIASIDYVNYVIMSIILHAIIPKFNFTEDLTATRNIICNCDNCEFYT